MKKYKLNKGVLIAIEGIDGAGKTTQAHLIKDYFKKLGLETLYLKEPTNGIYGKQIRNLALNGRHSIKPEDELDLFIKDRIEDCKYNIEPALKEKKLVIIDRYYFSSIAYQGALDLNKKYILERNEEVAIIPDLVIILDVAAKLGLSRIRNIRNEVPNYFEEEEYLNKVRKIFKQIDVSYVQIIDGTRKIEEVFDHVENIVKNIIAPHTSIDDRQLYMFNTNSRNEVVKFKYN